MIGVFDSGFGGLTILESFVKTLPQYDYVYLGDNARAPYGDKSDEVIYNYTYEAIEFLFDKNCQLIILACHTASAKALRKIQQEYLPYNYPDRRVLGVVVPVIEEAVNLSRFSRLGVIGTRAIIHSHVYSKELEKIKPGTEIYEQACPLLVPLVEEGWIGKPETNKILKKYLKPLKDKEIDTLILGCTHYPFLEKDIKRILGSQIKIVNPAVIVADKLKDYLSRHEKIEKKLGKNKKREFFTTDDEVKFKRFAKKFYKGEIEEVKRVK